MLKTGSGYCSEEEETVEKKLYTLYLKAKENFQELGVSTCFVSLGILKYKDADNSGGCPTILFS